MTKFEEQAKEVLFEAIAKTLGVDASTLTLETQPIADLGAKSTNFVHIISALEDEFELDVPFMPFRRQKTIAEMIGFVSDIYES